MRGLLSLAVLTWTCLAAVGCGTDSGGPMHSQRGAPVAASVSPIADSGTEAQSRPSWAGQKLIRNATLSLEVQSVDETLDEIRGVADHNSALVAGSRFTAGDDGIRTGTITIRVPSEHFTAAIQDLRGLGKVKSESIDVQDVTKAYLDLETRLAVKQGTAERLRELLQGQTGDLADVLAVERELERVVTEIEQLKGERRFFDRQIAQSTIFLKLAEKGARSGPSPWKAIGEAFSSSIRVLTLSVSALVYVATFLVPWLIVASVAWLVIGIVRRYVRERKRAV